MKLPGVAGDRTLSEQELATLVRNLAADEETWRPLVQFSADHRGYRQLARTDHVDIWILGWLEGQDTGFHDHDVSAAAIAVVEGSVVEERLALGRPNTRNELAAGDVLSLDASCIHRMYSETAAPAITIHAYSPVPQRNGAYIVDEDGTLRRQAQDADEELTPLAVA